MYLLQIAKCVAVDEGLVGGQLIVGVVCHPIEAVCCVHPVLVWLETSEPGITDLDCVEVGLVTFVLW